MQSDQDIVTEIAPINPIRVETALPRFPIHRLAKHGDVSINIKEQNETGEVLICWEVSHNSKYGQPGPLAYKLDTLIVNRRIEEATRPIPRIIRLGSLREITEEIGSLTHNSEKVKNALYQNAFAAITAKIRYRMNNGKERTAEIGDTRYGVVFTGEKLPDGRTADAVYIVLHDFYIEILNNSLTRPLDYDYLKDLAPTAQRLYELLSYHIYSSLKNDRARAKLIYSEFCTYAPQTRYTDFNKVKKQMFKLNSIHKRSGYISRVDFHQTIDAEGRPDWIMLYMPGLKARAEFQAFAKRAVLVTAPLGQSSSKQEILLPEQKQLDLKLATSRKNRKKAKEQPVSLPLVAELVKRGVSVERATELVEQYPERIGLQIEHVDFIVEKNPSKVDDPAAYLVKAIERNNAAPPRFKNKAQREQEAKAKLQSEQQTAEEDRRKRSEEARTDKIAKQAAKFLKSCTPEQLAQLEADAIAQASEETRQGLDKPIMKPFRKTQLFVLVREHVTHLIESGQLVIEPA